MIITSDFIEVFPPTAAGKCVHCVFGVGGLLSIIDNSSGSGRFMNVYFAKAKRINCVYLEIIHYYLKMAVNSQTCLKDKMLNVN